MIIPIFSFWSFVGKISQFCHEFFRTVAGKSGERRGNLALPSVL
jgi:hypothetical protein